MTRPDEWQDWQNHVLAELQRLGEKSDCLDKKLGDLRVEVGKLGERVTLRATVVGLLAGSLPVILALLLRRL